MIYLYLFGTCFHFIYVFMIICNNMGPAQEQRLDTGRVGYRDVRPLVYDG